MDDLDLQDDRTDGADEGYRSLSALAVLGLVLGIASPACFAADLLIIVPLAAVAVSLLALGKIAANPDFLAGRALAQVGAVIAVVSLSATVAKGMAEKWILGSSAQPAALAWVEHVRTGRINDAYALTVGATADSAAEQAGADSPAGADSHAGHDHSSPSGEDSIDGQTDRAAGEEEGNDSKDANAAPRFTAPPQYTQNECVSWLLEVGPGDPPRLMGTGAVAWQRGGAVRVRQTYLLSSLSNSPDAKFAILLERSARRIGGVDGWRVVEGTLSAGKR